MGWGQRYRPGLRSDPGEGEIHQEPGQSPRVSGHHQRCWQSVLAATTKDHRSWWLKQQTRVLTWLWGHKFDISVTGVKTGVTGPTLPREA